jgi:hypothetical protein
MLERVRDVQRQQRNAAGNMEWHRDDVPGARKSWFAMTPIVGRDSSGVMFHYT